MTAKRLLQELASRRLDSDYRQGIRERFGKGIGRRRWPCWACGLSSRLQRSVATTNLASTSFQQEVAFM